MRILVVEDDAMARELVRWQLMEVGHEVDMAADASQALSCLKTQRYEVIVTDLQMPGMDGVALCEAACGLGYGGHWIVMTGAHTHERIARTTLPVLFKPFRSADLLKLVDGAAATRCTSSGASAAPGARADAGSDTGVHATGPLESPLRMRGSRT
jgi:DNA-binding response OmpR family regulator